jgi:hypothetical protein
MLPRDFKFICFTRGKLPSCYLWMYTSTTASTSSCAATTRLRPHALYVNLVVHRGYLPPVAATSPQLRRASECLGKSRGSSRRSSSTTPGSSSTTSPPLRVRVPQHIARLVAPTRRRLLRVAQSRRRLLRAPRLRLAATLALLQPRRGARLLALWQHWLYFEYAARLHDVVFRSHRVDHSSLLVF